MNGEEKLRCGESGDVSAASRSSKEVSQEGGCDVQAAHEAVRQSSPVKEVEGDKKKKKKGLRTPSFLKKKKHRKEEKAASEWQNRSQ